MSHPAYSEIKFLTPAEAAEIIGIKPSTLKHWRTAGKGPCYVRIGHNDIRYRLSDIKKWADSRLAGGGR